jgi:hypothetical protein
MAEIKLKLIKNQKNQTAFISQPTSHISSPTAAEQAEAARFKALTATKAARQAMLYRIMSELQDLDETQSAA